MQGHEIMCASCVGVKVEDEGRKGILPKRS